VCQVDQSVAIAEAIHWVGATLHQDCAARGIGTTAGTVSNLVIEKGAICASAVLRAGRLIVAFLSAP